MLSLLLTLISTPAIASQYSPPGLYDVDHLVLDNGMDVILKPRQGAHTLSIRVWVGVGSGDFSCEQNETPHFLEHLLFTGTSKHTEAELENMVTDHGGYWNAATGIEETTYDMDIYSRNAGFAINTLYEILTDSTITEENVNTSRDIIHRESGGKPSDIAQWFRLKGIGVDATSKAVKQLLPGVNYICDGFTTADGITREDIIDTFNKYYVPGNMALIIVGDFNKQEIIEKIKSTFGLIEKKPLPERIKPVAETVTSYASVTGTLSPFLNDDANIGLMYRIPGYWSDEQYPLMLLAEYLNFNVIERLRIERGLSYSPTAWSSNIGEFGLFGIAADVNIADLDETVILMKKEMSNLINDPMTAEQLDEFKLKILLRSVQGYEANSDFANHYASNYIFFRKDRFYTNDEDNFEAVTIDDINRVVKKHLTNEKAVLILDTPTLTYTQFYIVLSLFSLVVLSIMVILYMRIRVSGA